MKRSLTTARFSPQAFFALAIILLALVILYRPASFSKSHGVAANRPPALARWGQETRIFAKERGNPWINVRDGYEVVTDFAGAAATQSLRPLYGSIS